MHLWISATRDNHVWVAVRQIVNYYVKLGGLKPLLNIAGFNFFTLNIQFYSQSGELAKEFDIAISNLDFNLYDSYWLKDTSYFRPRLGKRENLEIRQENIIKKRELRNWKGQKKFITREDYEFEGNQQEVSEKSEEKININNSESIIKKNKKLRKKYRLSSLQDFLTREK
jgi:hypothetical protein